MFFLFQTFRDTKKIHQGRWKHHSEYQPFYANGNHSVFRRCFCNQINPSGLFADLPKQHNIEVRSPTTPTHSPPQFYYYSLGGWEPARLRGKQIARKGSCLPRFGAFHFTFCIYFRNHRRVLCPREREKSRVARGSKGIDRCIFVFLFPRNHEWKFPCAGTFAHMCSTLLRGMEHFPPKVKLSSDKKGRNGGKRNGLVVCSPLPLRNPRIKCVAFLPTEEEEVMT